MASVKPVAGDDFYSFSESQEIKGNLLDNDIAGANGKMFLRFFDGMSVGAKKADQVTEIPGDHGTFFVKADGSYTYQLNETAKLNFLAGDKLVEKLTYKISDGGGNTDVGVMTLEINGETSKPTAVDDTFVFNHDGPTQGNVLANDLPGEDTGKLFLRFVDGQQIDAKHGADKITDVEGEYGTFHFKSNGDFTYDVSDEYRDRVDAGESFTEHFQYYKLSDGAGHTDVASLTLQINSELA